MRSKTCEGLEIHQRRPLVEILGVLLLLLTLVGCTEREEVVGEKKETGQSTEATTRIADILGSPESFDGRDVTIEGTAIPGLAFEYVDEQPYRLKDPTGEIWVITRGYMPEEGRWVVVKGTVVSPYQIKGRRFEVAVIERERR